MVTETDEKNYGDGSDVSGLQGWTSSRIKFTKE